MQGCDPFELAAAEIQVGAALRIAGPVGSRSDDLRDGRLELPGCFGKCCGDEPFPDILHGLRGGMHQVVGVEPVVAQVVHEDFVGGKVGDAARMSGKFFGSQPQRRLADGVSRKTVAQMAYGAYRKEQLLVGKRPFDEFRKRFDDFRDREPPAGELRGGTAVAVGDHLSFAFVNPGGAACQDHPVGRAERLGARLAGVVHAAECLPGRRSCKVAVKTEMEPSLRIVLQLFAPDLRAERPDGRGDRQRIEENTRRVGRNVEPGACEAVGDMCGKAGAEGERAVLIAETYVQRCDLDFGAEFHTAKIEISYLCCMILQANCKINLGLDILRRRADGYHDLETVMFPVAELCDEVEVLRTAVPGATFRAEGIAVDCTPEENICMKAFRLMQRRYGVEGIAIRLVKRIPFGAGLGGGSSDGTVVLRAIDTLFDLRLPEEELIACAAELGSDTAFFVRNTPQLCSGRGEVMAPFDLHLQGLTLVVVKPAEGVSTREAYAGVYPRIPDRPLSERLRRPVSEWQGTVTNDFETSVFAAHPAIGSLKERLLQAGALYASMSGSGSAVFGLFEAEKPQIPLREGEFFHRERIR